MKNNKPFFKSPLFRSKVVIVFSAILFALFSFRIAKQKRAVILEIDSVFVENDRLLCQIDSVKAELDSVSVVANTPRKDTIVIRIIDDMGRKVAINSSHAKVISREIVEVINSDSSNTHGKVVVLAHSQIEYDRR